MGVREDVLEEEVRPAAVLQGAGPDSSSDNTSTQDFTKKNLTLKKRPTFPSLLASRMLVSISVNALFKLLGFFASIWRPFVLQTLAAAAPGASDVVWADVGSAPEDVAGSRPPSNPS